GCQTSAWSSKSSTASPPKARSSSPPTTPSTDPSGLARRGYTGWSSRCASAANATATANTDRTEAHGGQGGYCVLFAYVDESGDGGFLRSPSTHYALGTIVIPSDRWLEALDAVVAFRRHIRGAYGVPMTAELKAQYLLRGGPG